MKIVDVNGIKLYYLYVDKFTTSRFGIIFQTEADIKTYTTEKIMRNLITKTSKSYQTEESFTGFLQDLYSASIDGAQDIIGNTIISNYYSTFINDEYVNNNSDIFSNVVKLLNEIFTSPTFYQNNKFNEELINKEKELIYDNYDFIDNDDMIQALSNILNEIYNCPFEKAKYSRDKEVIKNITNEDILNTYHKIVNSKKIFYYIGNYDLNKVVSTINENWSQYSSTLYEINYINKLYNDDYSLERKEINKDNLQSLIFNVYITEDDNFFDNKVVGNLFSKLIGGRSSSDLFQEVREKYNYCYFINSVGLKSNRTFIIYSGVSKENINPTIEIVDEIVKNYQNGIFNETHLHNLEAIKVEYINDFNKQLDKISGYYTFVIQSILTEKEFSIQDEINKINNVTLEDISKYAAKYQKKLDYIVIGSVGDENE